MTDIKRLADMPPRIRKKIVLAIPDDELSCWLWQARARPGGRRLMRAAPLPSGNARTTASYVRRERALPVVRCAEAGARAVTPAHRVIYAISKGISVQDVPMLKRCSCDECVSPFHVTALAGRPIYRTGLPHPKYPEAAPRASLAIVGASGERLPVPGKTGPLTGPVILDMLRHAEVSSFADPEAACEEAGLPAGSITPDLWKTYVSMYPDDVDD